MPTTPTSTPSSSASVLSIEWRPSTWVVGVLWCLGPLGAVSLMASDLPAAIAWPAAGIAIGLGWRASRRELRRAPVTVAWPPDAPPSIDGRTLDHARLQWRGPLAFLQWREGRRLRGLSWWPDTLPPAARRELRLATGHAVAAPGRASMAP